MPLTGVCGMGMEMELEMGRSGLGLVGLGCVESVCVERGERVERRAGLMM